MTQILGQAEKETIEAQQLLLKKNDPLVANQSWIQWTPPPQGTAKVNTNGVRKSSIDLASAGGLIREHLGSWSIGFTAKIGHTNSYIAELWGIREGLKLALNSGCFSIMVETDSKAVVKVFSYDSTTSQSADTLIADCKFLIRQFHNFKMMHVLREDNQCADFLANQGQSSLWGTTILDSLSKGLATLLDHNAMEVSYRRFR